LSLSYMSLLRLIDIFAGSLITPLSFFLRSIYCFMSHSSFASSRSMVASSLIPYTRILKRKARRCFARCSLSYSRSSKHESRGLIFFFIGNSLRSSSDYKICPYSRACSHNRRFCSKLPLAP